MPVDWRHPDQIATPDKERTPLRQTAWVTAYEDNMGYMKYSPQFNDRHPHNLITSKAVPAPGAIPLADNPLHYPVLDIDVPVRLVASATPGHHHLFIDQPVRWSQYLTFLRGCEVIGLIEPGYLAASEERKHTAAWKQVY